MSSAPEPAAHVAHVVAHLEYSQQVHAPDRIAQLLARCALRLDGSGLARLDGSAPGDDDCRAYLVAVRRVLGEASYLFAKTTFLLANCESVR